jgi:putative aminopeptidase FrvX
MQPARLILRVGITTQRLHGSAPIAIERGLKAAADLLIACAFEVNEPRSA